MAPTVNILPHAEDRKRLLAIVADRNRPLKHVQRAKIVLYSAERLPVLEVARRAGVSRPAVWRWQQRYGEQGVDGLLLDKTRKPGRTPLSPRTVAKVLELTCSAPPGQLRFVHLDQVFSLSARAIKRVVYPLRRSLLDVGDHKADVEPEPRRLNAGDGAALFVPGPDLVSRLGVVANNVGVFCGAACANGVLHLIDLL